MPIFINTLHDEAGFKFKVRDMNDLIKVLLKVAKEEKTFLMQKRNDCQGKNRCGMGSDSGSDNETL